MSRAAFCQSFSGCCCTSPIIAIITGIVALARGTALTGRAVTGLILGATFGPPGFGFVYLWVYMYTQKRPWRPDPCSSLWVRA